MVSKWCILITPWRYDKIIVINIAIDELSMISVKYFSILRWYDPICYKIIQ